jgi:release factor glutamine methyltransferase
VTVREGFDAAVGTLKASGFAPDAARIDATVLCRHLLGWTTAEWLSRWHHEAPAGFSEQLAALTARRVRHEPVAYLVGTREFYGRPFQVTRAVLIPRPETEEVVEQALMELRASSSSKSLDSGPPSSKRLVIDIGTGSGCLAVTLALEWPGARIVATDISTEALEVARSNAEALGAERLEFHHVDDVSFVPADLPPADLVVSNPPYVPERDRASLAPDVAGFEPPGALFAGPDGLDVIRRLVPAACRALKPGGSLVMEMGAGQKDAIVEIAESAGFGVVRIHADLQGIPRVLVARRLAAG